MYDLILVPLDGSLFGESALPLALSLSRRTGAGIHLVTVQELSPATAPIGWQDSATDWARAYLEAVAARAREGRRWPGHVPIPVGPRCGRTARCGARVPT